MRVLGPFGGIAAKNSASQKQKHSLISGAQLSHLKVSSIINNFAVKCGQAVSVSPPRPLNALCMVVSRSSNVHGPVLIGDAAEQRAESQLQLPLL